CAVDHFGSGLDVW
nr:immunoglobulin heavy chain junction region [Macaca mulatta]MOV38013.1 immunoglobulin heavy chain junction region [Macaca mulatta]MOV38286.1 immunoglobulin heavy chain junction region [Macaca mulatta]MOV38436.1 immunoglobulin heavy chain junction region [Macaca mulatta]MOV39105.1 immunoglobulin heavy chain junction region [Macaca mulatta]